MFGKYRSQGAKKHCQKLWTNPINYVWEILQQENWPVFFCDMRRGGIVYFSRLSWYSPPHNSFNQLNSSQDLVFFLFNFLLILINSNVNVESKIWFSNFPAILRYLEGSLFRICYKWHDYSQQWWAKSLEWEFLAPTGAL